MTDNLDLGECDGCGKKLVPPVTNVGTSMEVILFGPCCANTQEPAEKPEKTITVSWYNCDCPWQTKYCDEEHRSTARVPVSVLEQYKA